MNSDNVDKITIAIIIGLFVLYIFIKIDKNNANKYEIYGINKSINMCGEKYELSNYIENDKYRLDEFIDEVSECLIKKNNKE